MRNFKKLQDARPDLALLNGPLEQPAHCLSMTDGGAELSAIVALATESGECQPATGYGKHTLKRAGRA